MIEISDLRKGLYHPCSENKGADQPCSYCTADLRFCFRIGKIRFAHVAAKYKEGTLSDAAFDTSQGARKYRLRNSEFRFTLTMHT